MKEENVTPEMVRTVYRGIEDSGLTVFLSGVIGKNIRVRLYVPASLAAEPLDVLLLSTWSGNAMNRQRCRTVGDVVDLVNSGEISKIRNIGRKSIGEIKTELLHKVWAVMDEQDRLRFCRDLIALNFDLAAAPGDAKCERHPA